MQPNSCVDHLGILLVTFNSCINPIVYSLHGTPFSKRLKNMICCCMPAFRSGRNDVVPMVVVLSRRQEQGVDDSSYEDADFVENGVNSGMSLERSNHDIRSELNE